MTQRIYGLELLRGLCALFVAVYHCMLWGHLAHFYSWGLYGVYVFFGISGAVLYHSYHDKIGRTVSLGNFLLRRFARLAPLYALCTVVVAVGLLRQPDWRHLLNLSLLFGFANPGQTSTVTGGWSLGIEFVLYTIFPVLIALTAGVRVALATAVVLFLLRVAFVEAVLDGTDLVHAWNSYTQPASFMFFFFGGMVVARLSGSLPDRRLLQIVGLTCFIVLFGLIGASDEELLTGFRGAFYSLVTILIVAGFFWSPQGAVGIVVCKFFGDISYGLYLIHPIVWGAIGLVTPGTNVWVRVIVAIAFSAGFAWLALRFYELPLKARILKLASGTSRVIPVSD